MGERPNQHQVCEKTDRHHSWSCVLHRCIIDLLAIVGRPIAGPCPEQDAPTRFSQPEPCIPLPLQKMSARRGYFECTAGGSPPGT